MKKQLQAWLAAKEARKSNILSTIEKSEDIAEVRSLTTELETISAEIRDLAAMIDSLPDETETRTAAVNQPVPVIVKPAGEARSDDAGDNIEYRRAFMNFVTRGTPIPAEYRDNTLTTDVAAVIPTIVVNRIVEKLEATGMILPLVTRTNYSAKMQVPVASVKPVATWVAEGATSDKQKTTTAMISFAHYKLRCEISMSQEVSVMGISAFETAFVRMVTNAMVKSLETAIISGNGTGKPKGILAETAPAGQALTGNALSYEMLVDAEAALPQAYEAGAKWCMTKKTFMGFIGLVDTQKQPIARVNYGLGGKPERYLLGREVVLCGDYMDSFAPTLANNKVFAFLFNFEDYVLNTVYDLGVERRRDWDTENEQVKAVMSADGKVIDKGSLVTIAKSA